MLEVGGLAAGYGALPVLRGIDFTIATGEIVAVLGSNGAGKSTLNNVLSGLVKPSAGRVSFCGSEITGAPPAAIVALGLIQVPEGRRIFPNLTIRENLEIGSYRRGRPHRAANLERVTTIFPRLRERMTQLAGTLSGGEQQMLAIGRGLMAEPLLLILDEPSLGLSPLLVEEMFALIAGIRAEGLSVLLVEQNVMQSLAIADRAYVLEQGRFTLSGAGATLLDDPRLRQAYLGL
ncbi:MAG TPA: ABC transporter ATP-binding protein [Stellaceae bacterium]|nr:ABC transporter ATP-binding protein [Stellaceae bacterium]